MKTIYIAKQFSKTPGGRYKKDGPYSGEEFRERFLEPLFEASSADDKVRVVLDGSYGYATSFLEEAFGGLARKNGVDSVLERFEFVSDEEPLLIDEICDYVRRCQGEK